MNDYPVDYLSIYNKAVSRLSYEMDEYPNDRNLAERNRALIANPEKAIEDQLLRDYWANDWR